MKHPYIVAISGGSGSGKTWLAQQIAEALGPRCSRLSIDWYYHDLSNLPFEEAAATNFDHPDAIDLPRLARDVQQLRHGQSVRSPAYDFSRYRRRAEQAHLVVPAPIILIEGIFALCYPALLALYDDSVYASVPRSVRFQRRLARDQAERGYSEDQVRRMWVEQALPMHEAHIRPSSRQAKRIWRSAADTAFVGEFLADLERAARERSARNAES